MVASPVTCLNLALGGTGGTWGRVMPADLEGRVMAAESIPNDQGAGGNLSFCRKSRGTDSGGNPKIQFMATWWGNNPEQSPYDP